LQHQQFIFWERGYIEDGIFASWIEWRREDWNANDPLNRAVSPGDPESYGFKWGWETARSKFSYTEFTDFMDMVFIKGARPALENFVSSLSTRRKHGLTKLDFPSRSGQSRRLTTSNNPDS
jgi:hypothetical protein